MMGSETILINVCLQEGTLGVMVVVVMVVGLNHLVTFNL